MSEYKKMVNKILSLYVFRHGQTTYNRDKRFTGFNNPSLTSLGIKEAKIVAKKLKNKKFNIAIHSSLRRSKDTLSQILKYHPECKIILEDDRIIERNYGSLNGSLHEDFIKKYGQEKFDSMHRGFKVRPPKGESFADVEIRVKSFISDLKKIMKKNNCNVALSAHGNSIRLLRKIMESLSIKETCELKIAYDNFYEYKIKV